jgi:hypothetical protein
VSRAAFLLAVLLAVLAGSAAAQDIADAVRRMEAVMRISGWVDIARDGRVVGLELDHRESIPEGVVALVEQAARGWRFEPDDAPAETSRVPMHMKLLARKSPGQRGFVVSLASAHFADEKTGGRAGSGVPGMNAPAYPPGPLLAGVTGTVYLLLRLGVDGSVQEAMVEQVNLGVIAREKRAQGLRKAFATAAVEAARRWRLPVPEAVAPDERYWVARVPVEFVLDDTGSRQSRDLPRWEAYIPGPRNQLPAWAPDDLGRADPDTFLPGAVHPAGSGRRLLTALDPPP